MWRNNFSDKVNLLFSFPGSKIHYVQVISLSFARYLTAFLGEMSAATLPPYSRTTLRFVFSPEEWDEIFAPVKQCMKEIHGMLQSKTSTSMSLPPKSQAQPSIGHIQDSQTDAVQHISGTLSPLI